MCDKSNQFCFICGLFLDKSHRYELSKNKKLVEAFCVLFNRTYVPSRWYEPEYSCSTCALTLKLNYAGKCNGKNLPFSSPMVWHRQVLHRPEDCYFCQTSVTGHHYKTRNRINYANVVTVTKPTPKDGKHTMDDEEVINTSEDDDDDETYHEPFIPSDKLSTERHLVSDLDYRDLVRDLGLSIRRTEFLGSRLRQWNLVERDFKSTFSRYNDLSNFERLFKSDSEEDKLVYCVDVDELFVCLNHTHRPEEWRLFIDGSCKSKNSMDTFGTCFNTHFMFDFTFRFESSFTS